MGVSQILVVNFSTAAATYVAIRVVAAHLRIVSFVVVSIYCILPDSKCHTDGWRESVRAVG